MASMAVPARRRGITYGKKTSRLPGFSDGFETLSLRTPEKKLPSRLSRPKTSPSSRSRASSDHRKADEVFDVPSSNDEDELEAPPSPTPKRALALRNGLSDEKKSLPRKLAPAPEEEEEGSPTAASNAKKRKRGSPAPKHRQARSDDATKLNGDSVLVKAAATKMLEEPLQDTASKYKVTGITQHPTRPPGSSRHEAKTMQKTYSRSGLVASQSEPIRLQAMVPLVDDGMESYIANRDLRGDKSPFNGQTPVRLSDGLPLTPPRRRSGSDPASSRKATTTPRQAKIWCDLLDDKKKLPLEKANSADSWPLRVPAVRRKLIDSLQASLLSSDPNEPSDLGQNLSEDDAASDIGTAEPSLSQDTKAYTPKKGTSSQQPMHVAGPRHTYAQQRSYLEDTAQGIDSLLSQPLDVGMTPLVYTGFTTNSTRAKATSPSEDDDTGVGMKNIHEIRAAGDTRRFDDEMNTMLDDVTGTAKVTLSAKRSALMDLVKRLRDARFKGRFVDRSYEHAFFWRCRNEKDTICGTALALSAVLVLRDPVDAKSVVQLWDAEVFGTLINMLDHTKDIRVIAKDRKTNMARLAQGAVSEMVTSAVDAGIWVPEQPKTLSPTIASLTALETLIRRLREQRMSDSILDPRLTQRLVGIASASLQTLAKASTSGTKDEKVISQLVLSILESMTVVPACATDEDTWTPSILCDLVQVMETAIDPALGLITTTPLVLRLCVNLANNNETNSRAFAKPTFIGRLLARTNVCFSILPDIMADELRQSEFDELLLTLGALFNLADMSGEAREIAVTHHQGALEQMLKIFNTSRKDAAEADSIAATSANVAFGYLAVFLGNLCLHEGGRQYIQARLPQRKLTTLVDAIEEFIQYNKAVDQTEVNDVWKVFTTRLQAVVETLKIRDSV